MRLESINRNFIKDFWRKINLVQPVRAVKTKVKPLASFAINLFVSSRSLSDIRKMWNDLAKKNARYFMNTKTRSREAVDEFEFKQTGQEDYVRYVLGDQLIKEKLGDFKNKKVLEIGCGAGRMTEFFAKDFKEIYGLDISDELIDYAKRRLYALKNVSFVANNGKSIPYDSNFFDLIFSYLVLQHAPDFYVIQDYLKEIQRTLRPGGLAKIQFRTGPGIQKWCWSYGVSLAPETAYELTKLIGLKVLKHEVEAARNLWLWLQKNE